MPIVQAAQVLLLAHTFFVPEISEHTPGYYSENPYLITLIFRIVPQRLCSEISGIIRTWKLKKSKQTHSYLHPEALTLKVLVETIDAQWEGMVI